MPSKTKREQVSDLKPVTAGPAKARRGFVPLPGSLTCSLRLFAPSPSGLTLLAIPGQKPQQCCDRTGDRWIDRSVLVDGHPSGHPHSTEKELICR
jgi:hypothetical protein